MDNNLNQLTKLAHRDGFLTVARKCDSLVIEIDQALKYLITMILIDKKVGISRICAVKIFRHIRIKTP